MTGNDAKVSKLLKVLSPDTDSDLEREEDEIFEFDPLEDFGEPLILRVKQGLCPEEKYYLDSSDEDEDSFALLAPIPLRRQMGRVWKTFNVDFALL
jgi:hypothetical protein